MLRGDHYQVGVAMAYDLGRSEQQDLNNLRGLGDIGAAPVAKLYGTWVLARKFPLILRIDAASSLGVRKGLSAMQAFICRFRAVLRRSSCLRVPPFLLLRIITCKLSTE